MLRSRLVTLLTVPALLLSACPGPRPELDPKYRGTGGDGGQGAGGGCPSALASVCARGPDGVLCATSNGADAFEAASLWAPGFSDANGWDMPGYYDTIRFPDVDGDGRADVCGRAADGLRCGASTGGDFGPDDLPLASADFSDANGWAAPLYHATIRFPDVDGDGRDDVCARASTGIHCALSTDTGFGPLTLWSGQLSDMNDWAVPSGYTTIQYPDVDGDGRADLCARALSGVVCAPSLGNQFGDVTVWSNAFDESDGWGVVERYSTIRFVDVNADGMADVCGRAADGIRCGLSMTTTFSTPRVWLPELSDANGWNDPAVYRTIGYPDVDGDGRADLCARAGDGLRCALNDGSVFGMMVLWSSAFSNANGWGSEPLYRTIVHPDLDGDGRDDVCGRSATGMTCGLSSGSSFMVGSWSSDFSDAQGFGVPSSYTTLSVPILGDVTCP